VAVAAVLCILFATADNPDPPTSGTIARTGVLLARKQQPDIVRSPVDHETLPVVSCVPDRFCPVVTAVREQKVVPGLAALPARRPDSRTRRRQARLRLRFTGQRRGPYRAAA
jgi:hypothetical protein